MFTSRREPYAMMLVVVGQAGLDDAAMTAAINSITSSQTFTLPLRLVSSAQLGRPSKLWVLILQKLDRLTRKSWLTQAFVPDTEGGMNYRPIFSIARRPLRV